MITAASNIPKSITIAKASLDKAYQQWFDTGMFYDNDKLEPNGAYNYDRSEFGVPNFIVRRIVRQVARELKRPFIPVSEYIELDGMTWKEAQDIPRADRRFKVVTTSIAFPRRKYLSPITTPLLMAAHVHEGKIPWSQRLNYPILAYIGKTYIGITFTNRDILDEYTAQMQTREEMRAALKLPTTK